MTTGSFEPSQMSPLHDLKHDAVIFFAAIINQASSSSSMKIIVLRNCNEAKLHCHSKFHGLQLLKRQEAAIEMWIFEIQIEISTYLYHSFYKTG